ncbi:MAG: hypothetical protein ACP5G4_10130, partial [bacterium]
ATDRLLMQRVGGYRFPTGKLRQALRGTRWASYEGAVPTNTLLLVATNLIIYAKLGLRNAQKPGFSLLGFLGFLQINKTDKTL